MSQAPFYRALEAAQQALALCPSAPPEAAAQAVHSVVETLVATTAAAPECACRPGCAYCCHFPVGVTFAEAMRLLHCLEQLSPRERERIEGAIHDEERATAQLSWSQLAVARRACPLLHDNRCVAYSSRPLPCRSWTSASAAACEREFHAMANPAALPIDSEAFLMGLGAGAALAQHLEGRGMPPQVRELRSVLAMLLNAGGVEGGAPALAAAFCSSRQPDS